MNQNKSNAGWLPIIAVFSGFFIMGFVDVVGIATNYVRVDFNLSSSLANTLPSMVFLWFALFSIPTGAMMGRIGRKKTVLLSLAITTVAMIIPYLQYNFTWVLIAFALLGISNTILQVSLNPLVAAMFDKGRTASVLSTGQFIKSISSLLGPIIVAFSSEYFGNWRVTFLLFSIVSLLSVVLLSFSKIEEVSFSKKQDSFKSVLFLLKNKYILYCFLSIFLIVGIDVGINTSAPELLMKRAGVELNQAGLGSSLYFAAKTIGTLLGAILLLKIKSIKFLRLSLILAIISLLPLIFGSDLWGVLVCIFIFGLACANVFSIIFSLALNELPEYSNEISALMIVGVAGGAVIPPIQGIVNDGFGLTASMSVLFISLVIIILLTYQLHESIQRK